MAPLPVCLQIRRNTEPRRRHPLCLRRSFYNLEFAYLIKLHRLSTAVLHRQTLSRHNVSNTKSVLCLSTFADADEEFPLLVIDQALYS
jgi:hypothetical protein